MDVPVHRIPLLALLNADGRRCVFCADETFNTHTTLFCMVRGWSIATDGSTPRAPNRVSDSDDVIATNASTPANDVFGFTSHGLTDYTPLLWQMDT